MAQKTDYKQQNELFLQEIARKPEVKPLNHGILYEILKSGNGTSPKIQNIVCVYYRGYLISGKEFDNNMTQGYPDAFRLSELIEGWQIALTQMRVGDKWRIYLPAQLGYGSRGTDGIPKNSTLIFEIELVSIA